MSRLLRAWRKLDAEQRLAASAALALLVTMFLPWYQQNAVDRAGIVSQDLNAFAVFSLLEASILIAVLCVLALLFVRAEGRPLRLPGSDGGVVLGAGAWASLVLVLRLFEKPGVESHGIAADVGVQWGIFFALGAAGLLGYAGLRMRAARLQPPLIRAARRRTADAWSAAERGDATERWPSPGQETGENVAAIAPSTPGGRRAASARQHLPSRAATNASATHQLSFDDEAPGAHDREQPAEPN